MKIQQKGQLLLELMLTIGLAAILIPALLTGLVASREGKVQQENRMQAVSLLKEAEEAVRFIKENNWNAIADVTVGSAYHPVVSGSTWALTSGTETINGFTRAVTVSNVSRDSAGKIVSSGGTIDPSTKAIDITISWNIPNISTVNSKFLLTRVGNMTYTDTTTTQFNAGTTTTSTVLATTGSGIANDGQVQLGAGGGSQSDWCAPSLTITPHDLPKSGVANAITAIEGRAFAGTGDNASGVSFANLSITTARPPITTTLGTFDGFKTNAVFGDANYGYLGTDNNSKEVVIVNFATNPYSEVGYFNISGSSNGESVFVLGNIGYVINGNTLHTFNLSSKSGSRAQLGSITLDGTATKIYAVGNYAYVAINGTANQLEIIEVSNGGATLTKRSSLTVAGQGGKDIFVNPSGTRAYLATGTSTTQRELFIINTTTKTSPSLVSSYEANGLSPKGVTVVTNNKAILVGTGGEEYQVINIVNETAPTRCGGLNIDSGVNGVSSVLEADGDVYSYIITGDASSEFKIIEGGAGAAFSSTGTFESATFDPYTVDGGINTRSFNRFVATVANPNQTFLKMQVGVAGVNVSNNCTGVSFRYVGPLGSSALDGSGKPIDYFSPVGSTITGLIPLITSGSYQNPGRCFRYKLWFDTSDSTQTPIFYNVIVNYSG
ncbi:MAG: hypothetical protein H0W89_03025 [Candidatus Levybacteria bacterium]|nr:hypothetical protein [Candidatus Levybacteria bacterium]